MLTGVLTGHCRLRKYLKALGLEKDERCRCRFYSSAEETLIHLLKVCGALLRKRKVYLRADCMGAEELQSLNPTQILKFLKESGLEETL